MEVLQMEKSQQKRSRGRQRLPAKEKRNHCVSVRLNPDELSKLDEIRGSRTRGEAVRLSLLSKLPPVVPSVNLQLRADLGRSLGNLSTLAGASRGGEYIDVSEIKSAVADLRLKLIGAKS